ncbi:amidohydrolase family protein [Rhodopirellula sp. JC639]|uniref:amidohydrolase family protein n=1 Tax=Stieleria mannarensis TaxID=2755585 RepID=UPI001603C301|nr:amidohydrolase family protein [Rhodopirellula sp. JC639]
MKVSLHAAALVFLALMSVTASAQQPWIIDPHTHFKGHEQIELESRTVKREPKNTLGQVLVPEDYRELADRLGIQSTLAVEAVDQDQPQFNDWLLDQAKSDLVCGYIARGDLSSDDFQTHHRRYKQSGYLNGYRFRMDELAGYLQNETARKHLAMLESEGMVVDLLIEPAHTDDVAELAQAFPRLKIVINHCFRAKLIDGDVSDPWKQAVQRCAKFDNVYMKISSILNFAGTKPFVETAPTDLQTYLPVLEPCFAAFGEDRVIFATNWGVSTHFGSVDDVVRIVQEFLATKGDAAVKKGMRDNAIRIYGINMKYLR